MHYLYKGTFLLAEETVSIAMKVQEIYWSIPIIGDITDGEKDTDENCARYQSTIHFCLPQAHQETSEMPSLLSPRQVAPVPAASLTCRPTPTVATIVDNTGEVTIVGIGTTTITATKAGDTTYNPATARYTLTIDYGNAFVTTWEVPAGSLGITIPTNSDFAYGYTVDWGDSSAGYKTYTGDASHTYTAAGIYTVSIFGTFPSIYFNGIDPSNFMV